MGGLKRSKANQRDFLTIGNGINDGLNQSIDCLLGVGFGLAGLVGKGLDQFGFVHSAQCLMVNGGLDYARPLSRLSFVGSF